LPQLFFQHWKPSENCSLFVLASISTGYKGTQLALLNKCRLWLKVTTLADITDGQGRELLTLMLLGVPKIEVPKRWHWPQQGRPTQTGWMLWQEALNKCIPKCSNTLTYPMGMWVDSLKDWKWQWNPLENRLAESTEQGWRIWLPQRQSRCNRLKCHPTNLYTNLNLQYQRAVVEIHESQVFSR